MSNNFEMNSGKHHTIITGASEGLGKALALECAGRNQNLVLVALPHSGLDAVASYIKDHYPVKVLLFELDLAIEESRLFLYYSVMAAGIKPNILINNAGIGSTVAFRDADFNQFKKQVQLNILSVVHLSHLFLPQMQAHASYILNISSLCTFFFPPKKQVYGATKSFIYFFSKSLRKELRETGVSVSVLCPGGMNTNLKQYLSNQSLSPLAKMSFLSPEKVARIAMAGLFKRKERIIPGRLNYFFYLLDKFVAQTIKDTLIDNQLNTIRPVFDDNRQPSTDENTSGHLVAEVNSSVAGGVHLPLN